MTREPRTIILTSYMESPFDLRSELQPQDTLYCTDGGYDLALGAGLRPDLLLGDFDSVHAELPDDIPIIRFDPVKDYTDLDLALKQAASTGARNVEIWGGIGGRLDQTIANIHLLEAFTPQFGSLLLRDGRNEARILRAGGQENLIPCRPGWYFSLLSLSACCEGVTIRNAKYEVTDLTFQRSISRGVSNEFLPPAEPQSPDGETTNAAVTYDRGTLLLVLSRM